MDVKRIIVGLVESVVETKAVIYIRSFLQIIYHSITMKVVSIDIQTLEAVIQDVFLYHSSITPET